MRTVLCPLEDIVAESKFSDPINLSLGVPWPWIFFSTTFNMPCKNLSLDFLRQID
jgi:hypothetical protein